MLPLVYLRTRSISFLPEDGLGISHPCSHDLDCRGCRYGEYHNHFSEQGRRAQDRRPCRGMRHADNSELDWPIGERWNSSSHPSKHLCSHSTTLQEVHWDRSSSLDYLWCK